MRSNDGAPAAAASAGGGGGDCGAAPADAVAADVKSAPLAAAASSSAALPPLALKRQVSTSGSGRPSSEPRFTARNSPAQHPVPGPTDLARLHRPVAVHVLSWLPGRDLGQAQVVNRDWYALSAETDSTLWSRLCTVDFKHTVSLPPNLPPLDAARLARFHYVSRATDHGRYLARRQASAAKLATVRMEYMTRFLFLAVASLVAVTALQPAVAITLWFVSALARHAFRLLPFWSIPTTIGRWERSRSTLDACLVTLAVGTSWHYQKLLDHVGIDTPWFVEYVVPFVQHVARVLLPLLFLVCLPLARRSGADVRRRQLMRAMAVASLALDLVFELQMRAHAISTPYLWPLVPVALYGVRAVPFVFVALAAWPDAQLALTHRWLFFWLPPRRHMTLRRRMLAFCAVAVAVSRASMLRTAIRWGFSVFDDAYVDGVLCSVLLHAVRSAGPLWLVGHWVRMRAVRVQSGFVPLFTGGGYRSSVFFSGEPVHALLVIAVTVAIEVAFRVLAPANCTPWLTAVAVRAAPLCSWLMWAVAIVASCWHVRLRGWLVLDASIVTALCVAHGVHVPFVVTGGDGAAAAAVLPVALLWAIRFAVWTLLAAARGVSRRHVTSWTVRLLCIADAAAHRFVGLPWPFGASVSHFLLYGLHVHLRLALWASSPFVYALLVAQLRVLPHTVLHDLVLAARVRARWRLLGAVFALMLVSGAVAYVVADVPPLVPVLEQLRDTFADARLWGWPTATA